MPAASSAAVPACVVPISGVSKNPVMLPRPNRQAEAGKQPVRTREAERSAEAARTREAERVQQADPG